MLTEFSTSKKLAFRSALLVANVMLPGMFSVMLSPIAGDADARPLELRTQLGLLPVHVGADARARQGAEARTDERALLALHRAIARDQAHSSADGGSNHRLALRPRGALLARVRVHRRARRQAHMTMPTTAARP